ncbi:MAG: hypothetical protein FWD61_09255, partial [Phycisphaerales bacterium]|nr:hypothetical protein [Phycisphaerales bacterium]
PLKRLFARMAGVDGCASEGEMFPACDVKLPLMSLGGAFGTRKETIPHEVPYLSAYPEDVAQWKERVAKDLKGAKLKVGLSWAGRPTHSSDNLRSIAAKELLPLFGAEGGGGVRFYSLQKGLSAEQVKPLVEAGLVDVSTELTDFAHSAALVANLDLVISVDTAVTHLAGALGAKTWTLLPYSVDWRWGMGREESPWYPTMRLFRQTQFADWETVIERVRGELEKLVKS